MSTTQKHRNFVDEPMNGKPVTDLAGIGPVLGMRLEAMGIDEATMVLGQFLLLKKNEELFIDRIKDLTKVSGNNLAGANNKHAADCYNSLNEWCGAFL